jgi:hypothetical protein
MPRQVTGGKLYLAGGHQLTVAASAVDDLVALLRNRSEEVITVTIVPGNQLVLHWSQIVALQIFTAGSDSTDGSGSKGRGAITGEYRG